MPAEPEPAARALISAWRGLCGALPGGWSEQADAALACVSTVRLPTLNGVWVAGRDAPAQLVRDLLERVAAEGLPHCLQLCPGAQETLGELALARGMLRAPDVPLMVLREPARLLAKPHQELAIRPLAPAGAHEHADLAAAGFEAPREPFRRMVPPALLELPAVRCYIAERRGEPVATGLGYTADGAVGVFNVATVPRWRGRGYGSAITSRVVADGLAAGGGWAWLQSSPAAIALYERLGFSVAERWQCWVTAA